ncbi:hypothetical protein G7046_g5611 [Stylonectria norvegica]|nr:hypothetical protein G7046_g5611 [Stylonectria norvegica]
MSRQQPIYPTGSIEPQYQNMRASRLDQQGYYLAVVQDAVLSRQDPFVAGSDQSYQIQGQSATSPSPYPQYAGRDVDVEAGSYQDGQPYDEYDDSEARRTVTDPNRTDAFVRQAQEQLGGRRHSVATRPRRRRSTRRALDDFDQMFDPQGNSEVNDTGANINDDSRRRHRDQREVDTSNHTRRHHRRQREVDTHDDARRRRREPRDAHDPRQG